jgi:hypothetical protein
VLLPGTDGLTTLNGIRHVHPTTGGAHGPDRADDVATPTSAGAQAAMQIKLQMM